MAGSPPVYSTAARRAQLATATAQAQAAIDAAHAKPFTQSIFGGAVPPAATKAATKLSAPLNSKAPNSVVARQQLLKGLGYNVAVDGIAGKFTNSAWQAYQEGFNPTHWNAFISKHFGPGSRTAPGTVPHANPNDTPAAPADPAAPTQGAVSPQTEALRKALANLGGIGNLGKYVTDPTKFATASANAKFDPQIAELLAEKERLSRQGPSNLKQLQDWYKSIVADARGAAPGLSADAAAIISAAGGADAHALEAFGGSASAGAAQGATAQSIGRNELAQTALADTNYLAKLPAIYGKMGAEAGAKQLALDNASYKDNLTKLLAAKGAKGDQFASDYASAASQALKDKLAIANEQDTRALLPYQLAQAGNAVTQGGLNVDLTKANINKIKAATAASLKGQDFGSLKPADAHSLQVSVLSGLSDKTGKLLYPPTNAAQIVDSSLAGDKFDPKNPKVHSWRNQLMRGYINRWNAQHPTWNAKTGRGPYRINPKTGLIEPTPH